MLIERTISSKGVYWLKNKVTGTATEIMVSIKKKIILPLNAVSYLTERIIYNYAQPFGLCTAL